MRNVRALAVLIVAVSPLGAASTAHAAADVEALLTKHKCLICHADRETKAGPAFIEVAAHYRGDPHAVATLAREIRRGLKRGGPWHMPPHPEISAAEASAMARYIMTMKP